MAKIYQRLLSKNIPREKRQDSFDPHLVNLLGKDSMCLVNLLIIPQKIFFFVVSEEKFCFVKRA